MRLCVEEGAAPSVVARPTTPRVEPRPRAVTEECVSEGHAGSVAAVTVRNRKASARHMRAKSHEFSIKKIEREINYGLLKKAFDEDAQKVERFIRGNLARMLTTLHESGQTQREVFWGSMNVYVIKVRYFHGEIQVLAKSKIGAGTFKTVEKVSHLFGPTIPNQPSPIYAYAKMQGRKALRSQIHDLDRQIDEAKISAQKAALKGKRGELQRQVEHIQQELLSEAALSKDLPDSGCIRMWAVCNQKDPSSLKGVMMEYCDGGDLWDFIGNLSYPLSKEQLACNIQMARHISQTIAEMHTKGSGICHLDLKCGNILLKHDGGRLVPLIADFGLAKRKGTFLPYPRGTPAYLAPEQYEFSRYAEPALDNWSLGIIFVELFYGREANRFLFDSGVQDARQNFFNSKQYPANKKLWEQIGSRMAGALGAYPPIDRILKHLLSSNPITRWTAGQAANAFLALESGLHV